MKLTAKMVKQGDTTFYETAVAASDMIDEELFKVDRWTPGGSGYQRELNVNHIRNIAHYLQGDEDTNVLPTSIIINARTPLKVNVIKDDLVELEISDFPLYITDGQHRIAALRMVENNEAMPANYNLAVTITTFSLAEEMQHFRKINTSANRAPKGLEQQLGSTLATQFGLSRTPEETAVDRAVAIVTRLATDPDSPWFERMTIGGQRKKLQHTTVQSVMVASIHSMFTRGRFADNEEDMNKVYQLFLDYWKAIASNFPQAFDAPTKHNIQRVVGLNAWHMILNRILSLNLNPTYEQFDEAIDAMKQKIKMDDRFWEVHRGKARGIIQTYGTRQAYNLLADDMWYSMPKIVFKQETSVVGAL